MRGLMKGTMFEVQLSMHFRGEKDVHCIPNIKVHSPFLRRPTEIDRILLTPWKIYFVEQKSFNSYIRGDLGNEWWLGVTGRTTTKIYNPIMQNFEHIRSFNHAAFKIAGKFLEIENCVVVPDSCTIECSSPLVMNMSNFINKVWADSSVLGKVDIHGFIKIIERIRVS